MRSLAAPFKPEKYHDTYREKLEAILADKAKGKHVKIEEGEKRRQPAKVVDIADALRKSLAGLKKAGGATTGTESTKSSPAIDEALDSATAARVPGVRRDVT